MAVTITGSTWATSGAASAGSTGLSAVSGLTHVGSTNIPTGSAATGYLESAENSAASFKIEATGTACAADGDEYWATFYLKGARTGSALPGAQTTTCQTIATGATEILLSTTHVHTTAPGFAFNLQTGTTAKAPAAYVLNARRRDLSAAETVLDWGTWHKITIHIVRSVAGTNNTGRYEVFANGMKIIEALGMDMNTNITWSGQALTFNLAAWTGCTWQVCGPISTVATATTIGLRPDFTLEASSAYVTKWFEPFGITSTNYTDGVAFQSSGNSVSTTNSLTNSTDIEYLSSGGQTPFRRRLKMTNLDSSGATVGSPAPIVTSVDTVGALPYNEYGWATVAFSDLLVPSGATLNIQLRNVANDANVVLVQITGGSIFIGGVNLCPWTVTNRYALFIHLNSDGRAAYTLINLTASPATTKTIFSAAIADWTPATLGKLIYSGVPGGPGGGSTAMEIGLCAICKWATISAVDSLSAAAITPASGSAVTINTSTSVGRRFPYGEERQMVPGGYYPMKELGMERRLVVCPTGLSGLTRRDWHQFAYSGTDESHGLEFLLVDGGSVNDIYAPLATASAVTGVVSQLKNNLAKLLDQCVANKNKVWVATMLQRTLQAAISTSQNNGGFVRITTTPIHGLSTNNYVTVSGSSGANVNGGPYSVTNIGSANIFTTGLAYVGNETGGTVIAVLSTQQELTRTQFNTWIRYLVSQKQAGSLLAISDIDADQTANAANYATDITFWTDATHPLDTTTEGFQYVGAGYVAKRMFQLRVVPPSPRPLRRLSN